MWIVGEPPAACPEQWIINGIETHKRRINQDIGERRLFTEEKSTAVAKLKVEVIEEAEQFVHRGIVFPLMPCVGDGVAADRQAPRVSAVHIVHCGLQTCRREVDAAIAADP